MLKTGTGIFQSSRGLTLGMVFFQLLKGCLSIFLVMLSASLFGAGIERDAWVVSWSVQIIIFKLLFGPINETFRAKFIQMKNEQGEEAALHSAASLLFFSIITASLVVFLFSVFNAQIVQIFAPGYSNPEDKMIIGRMFRLLMPTLFLSEMITLFVALINTYKSFYLPEIFSVFSLFINIVLLYFFAGEWGIDTLVIANYLSAGIFVSMLIVHLLRNKIYPKSIRLNITGFLPFLLFSLPLYLTYTAGQINGWSERALVSYLGIGHNAALDYARKFIDMPITMIIAIGSTAMTPILASVWVKEKNSVQFQHEYFTFIRMGLLIISPIVLLFCVCSVPLLELLLLHGKFSSEWIEPTARTLFWFGLGLFGVVFYVISGQSLLVQKKSLLYAVAGVCAQLLPVGINYFFYNRYGLPVFGLSWCIAQYGCGIAMFLMSKAYIRNEVFDFLKLILILFTSLLSAALCFTYLPHLSNLCTILVVSLFYCVVLFCGLLLIKNRELSALKKILLRK